MENASKALIIAGAILLAILIISLGIMIYNQASGVVNNNAISEVDITSFNQKFTQYEGDNVKGTQVDALIDQIRTNNVTYQDDASKQVDLEVKSGTNWTSNTLPSGNLMTNTSVSKAQSGASYKVKCTMDSKSGLVDKVTIENAS